jgi:hypothetical protein
MVCVLHENRLLALLLFFCLFMYEFFFCHLYWLNTSEILSPNLSFVHRNRSGNLLSILSLCVCYHSKKSNNNKKLKNNLSIWISNEDCDIWCLWTFQDWNNHHLHESHSCFNFSFSFFLSFRINHEERESMWWLCLLVYVLWFCQNDHVLSKQLPPHLLLCLSIVGSLNYVNHQIWD